MYEHERQIGTGPKLLSGCRLLCALITEFKKKIQGLREVKGLKKEEEEKKGTPVISESAPGAEHSDI